MTTNILGEVEEITGRCPKGIVLRESENGVVLEKYLDESGQNVDVLHLFERYICLKDEVDLVDCLFEARKYEPDNNIPIYIKHRGNGEKIHEKPSEEEKKEYFRKIVERKMKAPWRP